MESVAGADHGQGRKRSRLNRAIRTKIPCDCCICRGRLSDPRTVVKHALRPRYTAVAIDNSANPVAPDLDLSELPDDFAITPETHALLEAYDTYFAQTFEEADTPLYTSSNENDEADADPPSTAQDLILMHLEWMSTFRNTGVTLMSRERAPNEHSDTIIIIMGTQWALVWALNGHLVGTFMGTTWALDGHMYSPCDDKYNIVVRADASAGHMWSTLRALLPEKGRQAVGSFTRIQNFVKEHQLLTARKIPICPCGQTLYYDITDPVVKKKYPFCGAQRTFCQMCGRDRYAVDKNGTKENKRFIYYLPYQ